MKNKHKILKLAIAVFMVLSASLVTSETLAYWVNVQGAQDTATGTVNTGDWAQAFAYDSNVYYFPGDLVTNNGVTYEAQKEGYLLEPTGGGGKWNSQWNQV